jgi:hypothetical protein
MGRFRIAMRLWGVVGKRFRCVKDAPVWQFLRDASTGDCSSLTCDICICMLD